MRKEQTKQIMKSLCAFALALMMVLSSLGGFIEVKAAEPVKAQKPTITSAAAGSKEVKGEGLLGRGKRNKLNITTTIYVTVKNGETVVETASTTIQPKDRASSGWTVTLQNDLVAGQTVYVKQKCNDDTSEEVSAVVKETLASKHKDDLKMPSGDFYLEQYVANIVNEDEKAEAIRMLKDANPSIVDYIESVEFKIEGIEQNKVAYYVVNYTDNSKSEKISATDLKIVPVTEHSRKYILEPYNVMSTVIKGKLAGNGPFDNIKVQYSAKLSDNAKGNFVDGGSCSVDKNSSDLQTIAVNPQTGEFTINVGETLELGKVLGIVVKEPHKFKSCSSTVPEIAIPKVAVKDPKKITKEEKEKIAQAIRDANTTSTGKSKLPNGTGDWDGVPAVIQIDDSGNVKIFSGNDVAGTWDPNDNYKFVPETNQDGSYKLKDGFQSKTTFNKPEKLVSNLPPDTPKMENKGGYIIITPNGLDTDAKKIVVEYENLNGEKKTAIAEKVEDNSGSEPKKVWRVTNGPITVDENGIVKLPTREVKTGTKVTAYVVDNGGLVPEETDQSSDKGELVIENKYKVTYDANGGSGTMPEEEVNVGSKYRILENQFTPPANKEFDKWMIGYEPRQSGEDIEVNNDIVIKAIWKYIINPSANEVETIVNHPVDYNMYKNAIKNFPTDLKVEHIEVKQAPNISKVGGTQATIEVRFSDGQFRTIPVTVNVKPDPKDKQIEDLNKKVDELNKQITEKDAKITELNGKITDLEKQLKDCQEQCAADKAQCEKDKADLQNKINELAKERSNLEIKVKENRELIEQLRKEITGLEKQVEDWKKIAGEKDIKIKEQENSIKELNTKLETVNNANTELKEKLATATEKINGLEARVKELEGQVNTLNEKITELNNTITTKDTEIKTLNETITTLREELAKIKAEQAKDKEQYEKDKAELEKQLQEAKDSLTTKEKELGEVKTELDKVKEELSTEKAKTAGLEEQVKAKDTKIADLEKQIEELKKKVAEAGSNNTTIIEKYETTIKEKETLIEKLTSEKAELEKQLAAEKTKNENLEKQVTDLSAKADKAAEDLNNANAKISDLEKQLAVEQEKNKNLTEQLNKITTDLETKTKEVETLNNTVTELKEQLAKITAEQAKDKEACEKSKAELQEKLDKANQDLADKNTELDNVKKELEQAKADLSEEKVKNAGLTEKTKAQEEKITDLEAQLKALQDKLNKADTNLKTANEKIKELEKELAAKDADNKNLTAQVEKLGKDLEAKTTEVKTLTDKVTELEKQVSEKTAQGEADAKEIERLKAELEDLKNKLQAKSDEADNLSKEIVTLKETVKTLEGEKTELTNNVTRLEKEVTELKETIKTSSERIIELEKENAGLKADNKNLTDKVTELTEKVKKAEDENTTLKAKIDELNAQIAELNKNQCDPEELNKLKQEKAALEARLEGKDELIQELRNQIADLKKSLDGKDNEIKEYKEKIEKLETKIETLTKDNADLREKLATATEQINNLEKDLADEKAKNEQLAKEKADLEKAKEGLEKDKKDLEDKAKTLENQVEKLTKDKENLQEEIDKLKAELDKCPADATEEINKLKAEIEEKQKQLDAKDKTIEDLKKKLQDAEANKNAAEQKIRDLETRIRVIESAPREKEYIKEYIYVKDRDSRNNSDCDGLRRENDRLRREIEELRNKIAYLERTGNGADSYKEKYVTIFSLDSILYKTYLDEELMTQAEMTDFNGYIKPFVANNRTMLPMRYIALSLGLDVNWDNDTRTATFTNNGRYNALNPGQVTVNADTFEMRDQYGQLVDVDSKPIIKDGRIYISITNLIKAFGGSNGNLEDGIKNTVEWDQNQRRVLVYKYIN